MTRESVQTSPDFRRVRELPDTSRPLSYWQRAAEGLTQKLRTPGGTMTLYPIQAQMITEAYEAGGLFAMAPVGSGKTIPSLIIPLVLGAKRPLLLVPANLREKTLEDMRDVGKHFRINERIRVLSYEMLSHPNSQGVLDTIRPDLVVADEAHCLKDLKSTRTQRFLNYMRAAKPRFVGLSGTFMTRSLMDFWHLISLALPGGGSPLPYAQSACERWGLALDAKVHALQRIRPGVLLQFASDNDKHLDAFTRARRGLYRRMVQSLGVVATQSSSCNKKITIRRRELELPPEAVDAIEKMRTTWEAPNGDEIQDRLSLWRHAREIAAGYFSIWDPAPPKDWMEARKAWHRFVRQIIKREIPGLDSPFFVAQKYADHKLYRSWKEIEPTFTPNPVPIWFSDYAIDDAAKWLDTHPKGICWVEQVPVGQRLAEKSGKPYYGGGSQASKDLLQASGPIIASRFAHGAGKNLQAWRDNLFFFAPTSAKDAEQLIGRTHRNGQTSDIAIDVYLHTDELKLEWERLRELAVARQDITGGQEKLLIAEDLTHES